MYRSLFAALESGATVVTANNRLARSLQRAYGEACLAAGKQAWSSPDVLNWDAWLKRLWEDTRLAGGAGLQLRLLSDTQTRVVWEQVVRESSFESGESGRSAAVAAAAWRLVCQWEVTDAPEWTEAGLSPDQQMFVRWSGAFRDRCHELNCIDPARLAGVITADAEGGLLDSIGPLIFAGFDNWAPAAVRLRDTLAGRGVGISSADEPAVDGSSVRICCESDRAELEQAARWARRIIEANPDASVAVVVRDLDARAGEVRRVFMDVFCPDWRTRSVTELPVNFSYGEPLAHRPRVAAALNILQLTLPVTDYRRFSLVLRTPFVRGGREEAGARAALDLRLREQFGAYFGVAEAIPVAKHSAPGFVRLLETLGSPGRAKRSPREWADWIAQLLQRLGWPGDDTLDSIAFQELESWKELLQAFASTEGLQDALTWPRALALLERLAGSRLYQPDTGPGVIQVMGILEASGHEFEHVWVTGMNAENWPEARSPDPLLPAGLQRRVGMPGADPGNDLDYATRLTRRLEACAGEVVFSWPGRRDGESLRASELVVGVPPVAEVNQWDAALWADSMVASAPLEVLAKDAPRSWEPGQQARGGARLFNLQAQCPLRAFLELRLGAAEVERPLIGIGFKERGSLAHDVLEDFYGRYGSSDVLHSLDAAKLESELTDMIAARLHTLPGMGRPYLRAIADLEAQRLLPLLVEFVQLDAARDNFRVIEREQKRAAAVGPVKVEIRLDRLDELADGRKIVIDYKTGNVARGSWNPLRPRDMQLPLYATYTDPDIEGVAFAQVAVNGIGYTGIAADGIEFEGVLTPDGMKQGRFKNSDGEPITTWAELTDVWRDVLLVLAEDFAAGNCRVNPNQAQMAEGQFAVLTRICELVRAAEEGEDG